ncbi:hypothetical protein FRC03_010962 [Tulasnella sp. 419]|nr:hypothetical protein FRC03_010962 [Tulasnella sp. 419]
MMAASKWIVLCGVLQGVWALPQAVSPSSSTSTSASTTTSAQIISSVESIVSSVATVTVTSVSSQSVTTAVPSPTGDPNASLPSQAPLPPKQSWCPSEIFCAGALLQTVELAHLYPDSKTFVDKPTVFTSNVTLENFNALGSNATIGAISQFVQTNFKGEGQELKPLALNDTNTPAFLEQNSTIPDPLARAWAGVVDSYWKDLIRDTDETTLCTRTANGTAPCESSLIPLNHTFVVPGGRFREQYYWDSFWIVEGLLKSELYDIVNSTLQNFMDELEQFGFIPNGGRIYYLNRSQPPLFIHVTSLPIATGSDITRTFTPTSTDTAVPSPTSTGGSKPDLYRQSAAQLKAAILDLMWDSSKLSFYDFNITSNSRSGFYSAAAFYPAWNDIWPDEVLVDEQKAIGMFASVGVVLAKYNGTFPATFLTTGMQWDAPNTWPPHQYIVLQALSNVPSNVSTQPYPQLSSNTTSFSLVPPYQLGLEESQLPVQTDAATGTSLGGGDVNYVNGTWTDGGVPVANEKWNEALRRGLVNRYFTSVFCSWYSTGGSIPGLLPQLSAEELNATHSNPSSTGHMYEKLNLLDIDAAGSGGEYTVQAGFGWTNGVVLWAAAEFGPVLAEPKCPAIQITPSTSSSVSSFFTPKAFYNANSANRIGTATGPTTFYKAKRATRPDGSYIL